MPFSQSSSQTRLCLVVAILIGVYLSAESVAQFSAPSAVRIEEMLETTAAPELDFPKGCSVAEYLDLLESYLKRYVVSSPALVPDRGELELENVTSLKDVMLPPLQVEADSMTLMDQMSLVFSMTYEPELTVIPQDGLLLLTTRSKADDTLVTRTYPVLDVLNLESLPAPGPERTKQLEAALRSLVAVTSDQTAVTAAAQWVQIDGEGGTIDVVNSQLVVSQTSRVHQQIRKMLKSIATPESSTLATLSKQPPKPKEWAVLRNTMQTLQVVAIIGWLMAMIFAAFSIVLLSKLTALVKANQSPPDA